MAVFSAVVISSQASAAAARTYLLTRENSGETVLVDVGDRVIVKLPRHFGSHGVWAVDRPQGGDAKLVAVHDDSRGYRADFRATQPGLVTVRLHAVTYTFDVETPLALRPVAPIAVAAKPRVIAAPRPPVTLVAPPIPVANGGVTRPNGLSSLAGGTEKYSDGSTYTGGLKNGLRSGSGTLTFANNGGNVLSETGQWTADVLTNGTIALRGGSTYFGGFDPQGRLQGPGRFDNADGSVLTSTFVAGAYSGPTLLLQPPDKNDPRLARGSILVDVDPPAALPGGAAKETFDDGTTLVGTMSDGIFTGPATYVSPGDGTSFHATFQNGVLQGPFTSTDDRGMTIAGTIAGGTTQGPAILTMRSGAKCRGGILENGDFLGFSGLLDREARPDGFGTTGCRGQEQITGQWFHGKMVGKMVDRLPSGIVYVVDVGPYPRGDLVGKAFVRLANDDRAVGYMAKDGFLTKRGSYLTASTNFLIRGRWVDGTIEGYSYSHGYFVLDPASIGY